MFRPKSHLIPGNATLAKHSFCCVREKKQKMKGGVEKMPVGGEDDKNMSREMTRKKKKVNIQAGYKSGDAECLAQ